MVSLWAPVRNKFRRCTLVPTQRKKVFSPEGGRARGSGRLRAEEKAEEKACRVVRRGSTYLFRLIREPEAWGRREQPFRDQVPDPARPAFPLLVEERDRRRERVHRALLLYSSATTRLKREREKRTGACGNS